MTSNMISDESQNANPGLDRFIPNALNAPVFKFLDFEEDKSNSASRESDQSIHENAIAVALGYESITKVFTFGSTGISMASGSKGVDFFSTELMSRYFVPYDDQRSSISRGQKEERIRVISNIPHRILDAPGLRNDFYSTLVSWTSTSSGYVAVALGSIVYLWRKPEGAQVIPLPTGYGLVSCLAFSAHDILAIGRKDGSITIFDTNTGSVRGVYIHVDSGICCIIWKPDLPYGLLAGDETGSVLQLALSGVESDHWDILTINSFKGHTQQICGMAISPDKNQLAVGGNDNLVTIWNVTQWQRPVLSYRMEHRAAVKAMAFCPWLPSLLATGGGSHDRTIRFWHTQSGTLLDSYDVKGQVTALIWSKHSSQIAATFGFTNPDTPQLVSVYTYPGLRPVIQIPTATDLRVLAAAISPDGSRICVAANDETVRFYDIWTNIISRTSSPMTSDRGLYGSDIIEMVEGIDKPQDIIR